MKRCCNLSSPPCRLFLGVLLFFFLMVTTTSIRWPRLPIPSKTKKAPSNDAEEEETVDAASLSSLHLLEPLLQVPCSLQLVPNVDDIGSMSKKFVVAAFCDTGAQRTCMSWQAAQRLGLAHWMDQRYAGQATGVGLCRVLGRIPAQTVLLQFNTRTTGTNPHHRHPRDDGKEGEPSATFMAPAITVLESTGTPQVELLLGLDFLRDTQAVIDLQKECLQLTSRPSQYIKKGGMSSVQIPFVSPRQSPTEMNIAEEEGPHGDQSSFSPFNDCRMVAESEVEGYNDSDTESDRLSDEEGVDMSGL